MTKTILVTGAAGFIGFNVSKILLEQGYHVIGIDNMSSYYDVSLKVDRNSILEKNKSYSFYKVDITNLDELDKVFKEHKIDRVCHLAAQAGVRYSIENPLIYEEVNNKGFLHILELLKKYKISHVVYASSSSVYGGLVMPQSGFNESMSIDKPVSLYAATKRSNELMAYVYHDLYDISCIGLRFFSVYGPWGRPDMAYFSFTESIINGKPINVYNNGDMRRDFTYIDDVAQGVVSSLSKDFSYEIFNIGESNCIRLMEMIGMLEDAIGIKAKINFMSKQPGDMQETFADISRAGKKLGYRTTVPLREGLLNFVEWYKSYYKK